MSRGRRKQGKGEAVGQDQPEDELKTCISEELLESILDKKLAELKKELATKDCIEKLQATIAQQERRIAMLEANAIIMKKYTERLELGRDDIEQYQRRLCVRITGVEVPADGNESSDDCLSKVKNVFKELNVDMPDPVIDRAHRIGKTENKNGKRSRPIIVRFTTWRHRTQVYRVRKNSKKFNVRLDITKRRLNLIDKANTMLEDDERNDCFAFADINCRTCLKLKDGFHFFETEEDLMEILYPRDDDKEDTLSSE